MSRPSVLRCLVMATALALGGCATVAPKPAAPPLADPLAAFPAAYRQKAESAARAGDQVAALRHWRVVAAFLPEDREAAERVELLSGETSRLADQHFRKGVALLGQGDAAGARKELLTALRLDPGHARALEAVRQQGDPELVEHTVVAGDTVESLASRIMGDRAYGPLIARLNDLGSRPLAPGRVIIVPPSTDPLGSGTPPEVVREYRETLPPPEEIEEAGEEKPEKRTLLSLAIESRDGKRYQEAITTASRVPPGDPDSGQARVLVNDSYYRWGEEHLQKKKYLEALETFRKVDPGYMDVGRRIIEVEKHLRDLAEEHYLKGVEHYVNQLLEKAIEEWEATLALYPQHPKAAGDIEKAAAILDKLRNVK